MKNIRDIYSQFEQIQPITPSPGWYKNVYKKYRNDHEQYSTLASSKWIAFSVVFLIGINVFAFSASIIEKRQSAKMYRSKAVAGQFLISTSSSKY